MGRLIRGIVIVSLALMLGCERSSDHTAQGYVEGRFTYIASSVSGVLKTLPVSRGVQVKTGDLLFTLEEQPEIDLLEEAKENLKQLATVRDARQANLEFAEITYKRYSELLKTGAIQQAQVDNAKSTFQAATAELAGAYASIASSTALVKRSAWMVSEKKKTAPVDAEVFDTYYRIGEYTQANRPVLSLLAPTDIRVIFYIPEASLPSIKVGSPVTVLCDNCKPDIAGTVRFIAPNAEYTPPVIFSNDTNEKFVYRIEATFSPADSVRLHPGQPVRVKYS